MHDYYKTKLKNIMSVLNNKGKELKDVDYYLIDTELSLKAKGLLAMLFSMPNGLDISIKKLAQVSKDKECSIESALKELQEQDYLHLIPHKRWW